MTITVETKSDIKILHLHNGDAAREDIMPIMPIIGHSINNNFVKIIINMEEIKLIDSNGVGVLIAAKSILEGISGQLILTQLTERVMSIIKMMQLDNEFIITNTINDALQKS